MTSNKPTSQLYLLSCGYIRRYFATIARNINPTDVAQIVVKFLTDDWKFDYCYDYKRKLNTIHGIENNGKTLKCSFGCHYLHNCFCFYSIFSFGMKSKSGKHKIKFKINEFANNNCLNMIGIVSQKFKTEINRMDNNKDDYEWDESYNYIGWSASYSQTDYYLPNGLLCGYSDYSHVNNIFRTQKFVYHSNNENYKDRLPGIDNGDTVILQYDSDLLTLSFSKENDNGKLDSYISNLPKSQTFYWFVGHADGKMCLNVVDF